MASVTPRERAEEAWVEYVATLKQRLFFDYEREQWIAEWIRDNG